MGLYQVLQQWPGHHGEALLFLTAPFLGAVTEEQGVWLFPGFIHVLMVREEGDLFDPLIWA